MWIIEGELKDISFKFIPKDRQNSLAFFLALKWVLPLPGPEKLFHDLNKCIQHQSCRTTVECSVQYPYFCPHNDKDIKFQASHRWEAFKRIRDGPHRNNRYLTDPSAVYYYQYAMSRVWQRINSEGDDNVMCTLRVVCMCVCVLCICS